MIKAAAPLEFGRNGKREHHIGARMNGEVQVSLFRDADPLRVDHHHLRPAPARSVENPAEVQVAHRHVVTPDDDEVSIFCLLGGHTR